MPLSNQDDDDLWRRYMLLLQHIGVMLAWIDKFLKRKSWCLLRQNFHMAFFFFVGSLEHWWISWIVCHCTMEDIPLLHDLSPNCSDWTKLVRRFAKSMLYLLPLCTYLSRFLSLTDLPSAYHTYLCSSLVSSARFKNLALLVCHKNNLAAPPNVFVIPFL